MEYIEDGPVVFPLNTTEFSITDDDNSFVLRATLDIENSNSLRPGVQDQLNATATEAFSISGSGTTHLIVEAIGPRRLITTHEDFANFLRGVSFSTNDQAPDVVRNFSILVEEFPIGEAPRSPSFIPITVLPVNDQPILIPSSNRTSAAVLDDYLPQDIQNLGYNSSFLLSPADVVDIDRESRISQDFIGLAIVSIDVPLDLGMWQYRPRNNSDWIDFPEDLSQCNPFRVDPSTKVRFFPTPSALKSDGMTTIEIHAWDGSSGVDSLCSIPQDGGTVSMYIVFFKITSVIVSVS